MDYKDIKSLKEVCGVLTERYVIDIIKENNKLKNKIKELKKYEKPKIKHIFLENNKGDGIYSDEYDIWNTSFCNDITKIVKKFVDSYYLIKNNPYGEFKELFFDTTYCDIIDCFIKYFTIITDNKYWATRICDTYLTPIGYFLNENLNLENDKNNLEECMILTFDNIISHIISFELE